MTMKTGNENNKSVLTTIFYWILAILAVCLVVWKIKFFWS
jgi:hypothetical protein